jgi:hypothetical protein
MGVTMATKLPENIEKFALIVKKERAMLRAGALTRQAWALRAQVIFREKYAWGWNMPIKIRNRRTSPSKWM